MLKNSLILLIGVLILSSCGGDVIPKPKGYLRLAYDAPKYDSIITNCPFTFEINKHAQLNSVRKKVDCWYNITYPKQKATIYLSYYPVDKNLDSLLRDAQNLTQEHTKKADAIKPEEYIDQKNNVYGMIYKVTGNAASNTQFYVTDSTNNFLTGSVYFNARPNYDSILPASAYIRQDVIHLMETIKWK
ncbi:gliding motility lipoprotein GldD [Aquimarina brevivitae]|uniref:Protein involved in gliding motility GldD n=1 Tax=Aquimarina brevivitae TaxID=323412 RepID=A0A4Q7PGD5_9FLAO|nr:gliding motility lipoprotein GldD [Aquimarina brevivitae]RZS99583.1 protein involved in gliding motility GldD [Aquimarina brevivitae]